MTDPMSPGAGRAAERMLTEGSSVQRCSGVIRAHSYVTADDYAEVLAERDGLKAEVAELKAQMDATEAGAKEAYQTLVDEKADLKQRVQEVQGSLRTSLDVIARIRAERAALEGEVKEAREEIEVWKARLAVTNYWDGGTMTNDELLAADALIDTWEDRQRARARAERGAQG